jgi:hypothetical protein
MSAPLPTPWARRPLRSHYAKGADLKRKMQAVVTEFDAEVNRRRTKVVKPT